MADYIVKDETLADIADAIRHKTNSNEKIKVEDFAEQIGAISGGGGIDLPELTDEGAAADLLEGKQLINSDGDKIVGTLSLDEEIAAQDSLITQIHNTVNNLPDVESLKPNLNLQDKIVIPNASSQYITADREYDGLRNVIVEGDANLIASNIKSGVSIFGVTGTAESGGGSSSENVETCTITFNNESVSNDCPILAVFATVLENGVYTNYVYRYDYSSGSESIFSITIPNIVCGTKLCFIASIYRAEEDGVYVEIDGSAVYNSHAVIDNQDHTLLEFIAPSIANENCIIYYAFNA